MKLNLTLHDAKKELPKESGDVVVVKLTDDGRVLYISSMSYSHKYKKFNCFDEASKEHAKKHSIDVHYWSEMPERIEEEEEA